MLKAWERRTRKHKKFIACPKLFFYLRKTPQWIQERVLDVMPRVGLHFQNRVFTSRQRQISRPTIGQTPPPHLPIAYSKSTGILSTEGKQPFLETDHSLSSAVEFKNVYSYECTNPPPPQYFTGVYVEYCNVLQNFCRRVRFANTLSM
jgi:hypothetical protein